VSITVIYIYQLLQQIILLKTYDSITQLFNFFASSFELLTNFLTLINFLTFSFKLVLSQITLLHIETS